MPSPPRSGAPSGGFASPRTHRLLFALVALGWLALDQLTKTWAVDALDDGPIDVVWTLRFAKTYNTGASFSLGSGYGAWISVIALVVVGVLVWQGRSVRTRLGSVALGMIVGGALGNIADRAFRGGAGFLHGGVVDFIDFQWWPVFNLADIGVVVGGLLLVVSSFLTSDDSDDADDPGTEPGAAPGGTALSGGGGATGLDRPER